MKPLVAVSLAGALCAISALGGFWLGFRQGWTLSALEVSSARGVIALHHITGLQAGKQEEVIQSLDADIDQGLFQTFELEQYSSWRLIPELWSLGCNSCVEQNVVKLANYRAQHPSPSKPEQFSNAPGLEATLQSMLQDVNAEVQRHESKK